jgi:hypothetical protein
VVDHAKIENAPAQVKALLAQHDFSSAARMLAMLHPADGAELLLRLPVEKRAAVIELLPPESLAAVLEQMYQEEMSQVAEQMEDGDVVQVLQKMAPNISADLLGELEDSRATVHGLHRACRLHGGFDAAVYLHATWPRSGHGERAVDHVHCRYLSRTDLLLHCHKAPRPVSLRRSLLSRACGAQLAAKSRHTATVAVSIVCCGMGVSWE